MAKPEAKTNETANACDRRCWLDGVETLGQLERISGAHWDLEIGALTEIILERLSSPPAVMFYVVPGYDPDRRVLANMLETLERTALALNLPTDLKTILLIDTLRAKLRDLQLIKPAIVSTGPVMENVERGDAIDLLKLPVTRWNAGDDGRYQSKAHMVLTCYP